MWYLIILIPDLCFRPYLNVCVINLDINGSADFIISFLIISHVLDLSFARFFFDAVKISFSFIL